MTQFTLLNDQFDLLIEQVEFSNNQVDLVKWPSWLGLMTRLTWSIEQVEYSNNQVWPC